MDASLQDQRYSIDRWLESIVASVAHQNDTLQLDRSELWSLLDGLPVAILISSDRTCTRIMGNIAAQSMLRVPLGSNFSQSAPEPELPDFKVYSDGVLVPPGDLPMQRAAATGVVVARSECEIVFGDGSRMFIAGHCIPTRDRDGNLTGSLGAFIDVTEERRHVEQSALMAREMAHRVKNTVAIVQALAHGSIRSKLDPDDYAVFQERLVNIARAQDLLDNRRQVGVLLADLLNRTIGDVAQSAMARVTIAGDDLAIDPELALTLTIFFHELATNAYKYGGLRADDGRVDITWSHVDKPPSVDISISWRETGLPATSSKPVPGFGTKLIERLIGSLPNGAVESSSSENTYARSIRFSLKRGMI